MTLVVDTSALMAILQNEPTAEAIAEELAAADGAVIGAATLVEVTIVVENRLGAAGEQTLARLLRKSNVEVVDFTPAMATEAADGFRRYGKGRHPAALNLGDCHTYGVARSKNAPVLCVGNDFAQTDVETRP